MTIPLLAMAAVALQHIRAELTNPFYVSTELQSFRVQRSTLVYVHLNVNNPSSVPTYFSANTPSNAKLEYDGSSAHKHIPDEVT